MSIDKKTTRWHSDRVDDEVLVARWGHFGQPVLLFPTAGGDAEEIERFHMITVLKDLIEAGRIKVYSCDSVAGRIMLEMQGTPEHRGYMHNQFQEFVYHELVPAIRADCGGDETVEVITAGSSIGAFNALAALCRYPDVFSKAICMSGTFDIVRFFKGEPGAGFRKYCSPIHYLGDMEEGERLAKLRTRYVLIPSGEGRAEDISESWRLAHILGSKNIPNRVDSWGAEWHHDWPTWRNMLPKYLDELTQ